MSDEIWKDIDGYSNYQVSNLGNIKSLGNEKTRKEKLLKPTTDTFGYLQVNLYKNGKRKKYLLHRLVATAFIPNPECKPCIDHLDTNPFNNRLDNLKWCTYRENNNNPKTKEKKRCKYGKLHHNSKPILQLSLNGELIRLWDCSMDIQRELGYKQQNISRCCNGKRNTANGYKWCFAS